MFALEQTFCAASCASAHTRFTLALLRCTPCAGISGAGRSAKQNLLYSEATEGINAYGVTRHRHMPEIEQGLTDAAGKPVRIRCP